MEGQALTTTTTATSSQWHGGSGPHHDHHGNIITVDELVAVLAIGADSDVGQLAAALAVDQHHLGGQHRPVVAAVALGQVDDQREKRRCPTGADNVAGVDDHALGSEEHARERAAETCGCITTPSLQAIGRSSRPARRTSKIDWASGSRAMRQARSVLQSASISPAVLIDAQPVGAVIATVIIPAFAPSEWSPYPLWLWRIWPASCPTRHFLTAAPAA